MKMADDGIMSGYGTDEVNQVSSAQESVPNTMTDLSQDPNFLEARNATEAFLTVARKLIDAWEIGVIGEQELIAGVAQQLVPDLRADQLDPRFHVADDHVHKVEEAYIWAHEGVASFEESFGPLHPSQGSPVEDSGWIGIEIHKRFPTSLEPVTADQVRTVMTHAGQNRALVEDVLLITEHVHRNKQVIFNPVSFIIALLMNQPHDKLAREAAGIRRRSNAQGGDPLGKSAA